MPSSRRRPALPVGIAAFLVCVAAMIVVTTTLQMYASRLASRSARAIAAPTLDLKWSTLTLQTAALADPTLLPVYGASEIACCGDRYVGTRIFLTEPTGFDLFAVGAGDMGQLFFFQDFGSLGDQLRGKKIVVSLVPDEFRRMEGMQVAAYDSYFRSEIADKFVFDSPISRQSRRAGAGRMLTRPETLRDQGILRAGLTCLVAQPPLDICYDVLLPAGRAATWVGQLRDAYQTIEFLSDNPKFQKDIPSNPSPVNWTAALADATQIQGKSGEGNPFGFAGEIWGVQQQLAGFQQVWSVYCSGGSNRDGRLYPLSSQLKRQLAESAGWTDLALSLHILIEVGAQPILIGEPDMGLYQNYTVNSLPVRQQYYQKVEQIASYEGVPSLVLSDHDEDRLFHYNASHPSARGWVFVDRALDMFWHGESVADIRVNLTQLNANVPPEGLPPPARYCGAAASP